MSLARYFMVLLFTMSTIYITSSSDHRPEEEWGFFGHRRINHLAVFTLPPPLIGFYKRNIGYLTDHAVDPDKRRYASKYEAIRHYIDIDHWDVFPFQSIPRRYIPAILQYAQLKLISKDGTERWAQSQVIQDSIYLIQDTNTITAWPKDTFYNYFTQEFMDYFYEETWYVDVEDHGVWPYYIKAVEVIDSFSEYGVLPYNLMSMQSRLSRAMQSKDAQSILRLSSDYGHYIADGHTPLHTTENYNGQLSGQDGIHAFWESRIPELFADREFDYFVGKAEYIDHLSDYIWDIVLDSHVLVDSVLNVERRLRLSFPEDKQYCYDERNGRTVRLPCTEFTKAYQLAMGDMVEQRMRASIKAVGSLWYTAWINAGQPDLDDLFIDENTLPVDTLETKSKPLGRPHTG